MRIINIVESCRNMLKNIKISQLQCNTGQIDGLPRNPRTIKDARFEALKKSIQDAPEMLNLRELLVFPHNDKFVIIGGNMRLKACKELGFKELPCKVLDENTPVEKLREYAIKDNIGFGDDDWDALGQDWDFAELEGWGMEMPENWESENNTELTEIEEVDVPENVETRCQKGDIWILGEHRLMCGDSTDAASVALLMNGERADICFTSPPYNMQAGNISQAFASKKVKDSYGIKDGTYKEFSDNLTNEQYTCLLSKSLDNSLIYCDNTLFNIGILKGSKDGIIETLHIFKDKFCDILIWNKEAFMPLCLPTQIHLVGHICELIFCFNNEGDRTFKHSQWELGKMHNRIDTKNAVGNEYSKIHHATFPVELPFYIIQNFTDNSVLDLFGGTGTTLIAAEQLNRKCFMMELDEHYCDIIIQRWENLTNKKAVKLKD